MLRVGQAPQVPREVPREYDCASRRVVEIIKLERPKSWSVIHESGGSVCAVNLNVGKWVSFQKSLRPHLTSNESSAWSIMVCYLFTRTHARGSSSRGAGDS